MSETGRAAAPYPGWSALLRREGLSLLGLLAFTLLFYRQLGLQGRILVDYDVLTYFYPHMSYAAEALRAGHLPLWNPYLFTGVPFLANMQTAIFYPPNWAMLLLPVPQGYSLSVVAHVFLMAAGSYAFGRLVLEVGRLGALAGSLAFAFGGYASSLVTHLNQLQAAAWLPWLFLALILALRTRRALLFLAWAGGMALQLLAGHVQVAYISMAGMGLYVLYWLVAGDPHAPSLPWRRRLLVAGACAASLILAFGLAAIQLVPAAELSARSVRSGGMTFREATAFSLPPWMMLKALLPLYTEGLPTTEWLAYCGVPGVVLVAAGIAWGRRRALFAILLLLVALLLGMGMFGPLYPALFDYIPGLNLFRVPARWLLLYAFAVAALVALGMEGAVAGGRPLLARIPGRSVPGRWLPMLRAMLRRLVMIAGVLVVPLVPLLLYRAAEPGYELQRPVRAILLIWGGLLAASLLLVIVRRRWAGALVAVLLAGDLLAASQSLMLNEGSLPEAFTALRPSLAQLQADPGLFRTLAFTDNVFDPGDMAEMKDMLRSVLPEKGVYGYVVATKHKETLTPNLPLAYRIASLDGYDGGLLPLRDYVAFKDLLPLSRNRAPDGRLREQLESIPDPRLLGSLNVKYILTDRNRDAWLDDVYYDQAITATLGPGQSIDLAASGGYRVTALGLVSYLSQAEGIADGTSFATLTATDEAGQSYRFELQAGVHSAEGKYVDGAVRHNKAKVAGPWIDDPAAWNYLARLELRAPVYLQKVAVQYTAPEGQLHMRALSAIDGRAKASYLVSLTPDLRIVHMGDVKTYENMANLPRGYLVHRLYPAGDEAAALARMRDPDFQWGTEAVVEADPTPAVAQPPAEAPESVEVIDYRPEEITMRVQAAAAGLVVLSDSYYPGWRAWLDGQEVSILRANQSQRGVAVGPGQHTLVFRYQPRSVTLGFGLSVFSLALLVGAAFVLVRRRPLV